MPDNWHDINSPGFFFGGKQKTEDELFMEDLMEPGISEEAVEWEKQYRAEQAAKNQAPTITIHSLSWRHTEESRKGADKAREGDTIRLLCSVDGCANGTNVLFDMAWKDKDGGATEFSKASATLKDGVAAVDTTKMRCETWVRLATL